MGKFEKLRISYRWLWLAPILSALAVGGILLGLAGGDSTPSSESTLDPSDPAGNPGAEAWAGEPQPFRPGVVLLGRTAKAENEAPLPVPIDRPGRVPLSQATGWRATLEAHHREGAAEDPDTDFARLAEAWGRAKSPVTRQNLIFLIALRVPWERAAPWLRMRRDGESESDREDALIALAFRGDNDAVAAFEALARTPSTAKVHALLDQMEQHEILGALGTADARARLRSYRAIEVLDGEPYFKATPVWTHMRPWPAAPDLGYDTTRRLLVAWLARYPGHPGSDDVARRIAVLHAERRDYLEAARWYLRASRMPDQDVTGSAVGGLIALCELYLEPEDIGHLLGEAEIGELNRNLLLYLMLRKLAAERGFAAAVATIDNVALAEPTTQVATAWRHRYRARVPKGLHSGLVPLAPGDRLLRKEDGAVPEPPPLPDGRRPRPRSAAGIYAFYYPPDDVERLYPGPEVLVPTTARIARQVRCWEALADLEARAERVYGDERADLLYKQAAVFYHERDVLYPVYAHDTHYLGWLVTGGRARGVLGDEAESKERYLEYERGTFSYLRAIALFEQIEGESPYYPGLDRVVFSLGMSWKKLIDFRAWRGRTTAIGERGSSRTPVRAAVAAFERCAREFPDSPLADDANAAASYWRLRNQDIWPGGRAR